MPSAWAPTVGLLASKVCIAACDLERLPSRARARRSSSFSLPPSRQEPGMRQSSRWTSAVWEARRPCFLTLAPCSQPFVPGGITKAAWPRERSSRSTEAMTTWTSAMPPLVAQAFWPLSTHSSLASSYLALVRIAETSEPASGSEAQKEATLGSSALPKHCGIHSPICSGVPCPKIAATASEVPMIAMPMPASPQKSSSLAIGSVRPVSSAQNWPSASKP